MTYIDNLSAEDRLELTNKIAISLSKDRTVDEINILGNFIVGIGRLILTLTAQQQYTPSQQETKKSTTENTTTY
ncbi:hypothetical protein NPD5_156 [Clostridium sporogenes]|uniref:Uncharacterized protein n=1 Tax=Clostridium sporogenes TaxID=1509 RepID=A0A1L3NEY0_CLOSG|nr:hypothetical protein [Clostridium sporogenes]APH14679.1 hypothetical protein NPD5_156 [Clostridium sporogenes]